MEALLVLVVLTLGSSIPGQLQGGSEKTLVRFRAREAPAEAQPEKVEDKPPARRAISERTPPRQPKPVPPIERKPETPLPQMIRISPREIAVADIAALPPAPKAVMGPVMGPVDNAPARDTPRAAGSGPNGEPLYAASWYREPYRDELSGYLSTATGPGWGLIACRTAPDYRVEDCVPIDEYPAGSRIARAVLAAAWQFRVRPPRVGGQLKIGEWVRIRIDYNLQR